MIATKTNLEITEYREKFFLGLSLRQLACFAAAAVLAIATCFVCLHWLRMDMQVVSYIVMVEVLPFLEKVKELTFWRLQEKKLSLEISCTPEDLTKTMDQDLMMSLVMNLVDNAVKASKEGRKIWIRADERELSVRDEGKGIPLEDLARVTEAFYMVDKARSRKQGGMGLGLALVQEIARLHRAHLVFESEAGKGTTVKAVFEHEKEAEK
mgnify:CR=1 FL=1